MSDRKRLCFVVTSSVTATTFLKGYLNFLVEDGWDVHLICNDGTGLSDFALAEGVRINRISMKREPALFKDIQSLLKMITLFRRLRPDVIVYATPKASLLASVAGSLTRVPRRVYELWGLRMETVFGSRRPIFQFLEWLTSRQSSLVIANSFSLAARAKELGVNAGREVITLGSGSSHGVDTSHFKRGGHMPNPDRETAMALKDNRAPIIGFVGRLHPDKGLDTLIDALILCSEQGIQLQALIVGGDEGSDIADKLEQLRKRVPVTLVGHVEDPRPYLVEMTMLVLVSKREGFPNVVLEAAALEVPAIVSDATGCIDSVEDCETGVIVPVGNARALARAIASALESPQWPDMGVAARKRAERLFNQERVWKLHSNTFAGIPSEEE